MKRLVVLSALALAACASEPETMTSSAPPPPPLKAASAPGGRWKVVDDYAATSVGVVQSPYRDRAVSLDADWAVDPQGRLCKTPAYTQREAPAATVLGATPQPQAATDPAPRPILSVTCDGKPFADFVGLPDGTWLTRADPWILKLAKITEDAPPQPLAPMAMTAPPPAAAPAPEVKTDPRILVYLASYRTEKIAHGGFARLAKTSPLIAKHQPVTQSVDLGRKGRWVRLYVIADDETERGQICKQIARSVDECGARNRE